MTRRDMRPVQRPRFAGIEPFVQIMRIEQVQVPYLRAIDGQDPQE